MITLLFPPIAFAAELVDLASPALIVPGLFLVIALLAVAAAMLGKGHARTRRSLALLILLVAAFGILSQTLPLPLSSGMSLAIFLGLFAVIYLMGRFDAPD